jgi:hypothetical protein
LFNPAHDILYYTLVNMIQSYMILLQIWVDRRICILYPYSTPLTMTKDVILKREILKREILKILSL